MNRTKEEVLRDVKNLQNPPPGFRVVRPPQVCYFCKFNEFLNSKGFWCNRYGFSLGTVDRPQMQTVMTCREWKPNVDFVDTPQGLANQNRNKPPQMR